MLETIESRMVAYWQEHGALTSEIQELDADHLEELIGGHEPGLEQALAALYREKCSRTGHSGGHYRPHLAA